MAGVACTVHRCEAQYVPFGWVAFTYPRIYLTHSVGAKMSPTPSPFAPIVPSAVIQSQQPSSLLNNPSTLNISIASNSQSYPFQPTSTVNSQSYPFYTTFSCIHFTQFLRTSILLNSQSPPKYIPVLEQSSTTRKTLIMSISSTNDPVVPLCDAAAAHQRYVRNTSTI